MEIGIYGGKFDPPHMGHMLCAEMTRDHFHLDKVLFVTSANPPHKKTGVTDARLRHTMVEAACAPNCYFEACDVELRREGPSYTLDTVRALREKYGAGVGLNLLISSEYLDPEYSWNIGNWNHAEELLGLVRLLVFVREGHTKEMSREWGTLLISKFANARVEHLDFCPTPPVSSTLLRDRVSKGLSIWYMVLPEVWQIIREEGLYGCKMAPRGSDVRKIWTRFTSMLRTWRLRRG